MLLDYKLFNESLKTLNSNKILITTLNAYSYNVAYKDKAFEEALQKSDILIPDGISIVWALRLLTGEKLKKIAGADLFYYEMERINAIGGKCFFLGSTNETLNRIKQRTAIEFPDIKVSCYSPPYKAEFSIEENRIMLDEINAVQPDVLFVGMTAPKQEKWAYNHIKQLQVGHVCCIGAVFDFYAGTIQRAPNWMITIGLEWLYRLIKEPKRMWRRYLIGNVKFIFYVFVEKMSLLKNNK